MLDRESIEHEALVEIWEAADRAGAIVRDQVRAITEAAESKADEIRRSADEQAQAARQEALTAAARVLERIDAMEARLADMVIELRREVDALNADADVPRAG